MAPLSPPSPLHQITSIHIHTPTTPILPLPLGPHDGVVVRDDSNVSFFLKLTKNFHVTAGFRKNHFPKDGPPSSMVLLVFLESEILLKIRQFPNWEICLTGFDAHMDV